MNFTKLGKQRRQMSYLLMLLHMKHYVTHCAQHLGHYQWSVIRIYTTSVQSSHPSPPPSSPCPPLCSSGCPPPHCSPQLPSCRPTLPPGSLKYASRQCNAEIILHQLMVSFGNNQRYWSNKVISMNWTVGCWKCNVDNVNVHNWLSWLSSLQQTCSTLLSSSYKIIYCVDFFKNENIPRKYRYCTFKRNCIFRIIALRIFY